MAINFSSVVYSPVYDAFSRSVTVLPVASQPGLPPYIKRGIFDTRSIDVIAEDGLVISDQRTMLDIREAEFSVLPVQGDRISVPASGGLPDLGDWEIADSSSNGGGETTLTLRRYVDPQP